MIGSWGASAAYRDVPHQRHPQQLNEVSGGACWYANAHFHIYLLLQGDLPGHLPYPKYISVMVVTLSWPGGKRGSWANMKLPTPMAMLTSATDRNAKRHPSMPNGDVEPANHNENFSQVSYLIVHVGREQCRLEKDT